MAKTKPSSDTFTTAVAHVVYLSSNTGGGGCPHCEDGPPYDSDVGVGINHLIKHGYKVLHVGQESSWSHEGQLWSSTVAVLGVDAETFGSLPLLVRSGGVVRTDDGGFVLAVNVEDKHKR